MKTISFNVFDFDELSEKAKKNAIRAIIANKLEIRKYFFLEMEKSIDVVLHKLGFFGVQSSIKLKQGRMNFVFTGYWLFNKNWNPDLANEPFNQDDDLVFAVAHTLQNRVLAHCVGGYMHDDIHGTVEVMDGQHDGLSEPGEKINAFLQLRTENEVAKLLDDKYFEKICKELNRHFSDILSQKDIDFARLEPEALTKIHPLYFHENGEIYFEK